MPTPRRPRLLDAPPEVQAAVIEMLGAPIVAERPAESGFTPSIASLIESGRGGRLFVKAGLSEAEAVAAGATLAAMTGDLGPRLVDSAEVGEWRIAAYEVVEGETVTRWEAADLPVLMQVIERLRDLAELSVETTPYAEAFVPLLGAWRAMADGMRHQPLPVDVPIPVLAELESRWLADGTALHHGDLRRDNFIRRPDGRLVVVDWTHLWTAPGWLDLVRLIPDLAIDGHDPTAVMQGSCWWDAPADDVNVALAGLAGRAWRDGFRPGPPAVRELQREQGVQLLRWLETRLRQ